MSLSPMLTYDAIKDTLRIGIVGIVVIAENDGLIKGRLERGSSSYQRREDKRYLLQIDTRSSLICLPRTRLRG